MQTVSGFLPESAYGVASVSRLPDGVHSQLRVRGVPWMSDVPLEQVTNAEFVRQARGDVLIGGLGLGLIVAPVLAKAEVASLTAIEREADVIGLVLPRLRRLSGAAKLRIVYADVFRWMPTATWDVIYFDVWSDIRRVNLSQMRWLHHHYRPCLRPGGWLSSWTYDLLTFDAE